MIVQTSEATVTGYGEYGQGSDGRDIAYKGGQMVEYADVIIAGHEDFPAQMRRITLDRDLNGSRPSVGDVVSLTCRVTKVQKAYIRGDGKPDVREQDKWVLVGAEPIPAK